MKKLLLSLVALVCAAVGYAQTNLLTNGGFEEWADGLPTGWMKSTATNPVGNAKVSQSTTAHSGSSAVLMTNSTAGKSSTSNQRLATNPMSLKAGKYTYTVYAKAGSGNAATRLGYVPVTDNGNDTYKAGSYHWAANRNNYNGPDTIATDWAQLTYTFELDADATVCFVVMHSKNLVDAEILVDDASLVAAEEGGEEGDGGNGDNTGGGDIKPGAEHITIAEFLSKQDTNTEYELTGKVTEIVNTTYGNLYIEEGDAKVYIYGILDKEGQAKNFASLGVAVGDMLTITGVYSVFKEEPQIKNAKFVKVEKSDEPSTLKDPTNTPETAYTATQAIEIINNKAEYDLSKEVYVKGTIKEIVSIDVTKYDRAQYVITDGVNDFLIYNGYYLKGEKFTADDQIKVGDEVVVLGTITLYGEKYEMNANNKLYSINGVTEPVKPTITNPVLSVMTSYSDATGKSHNFLTEDGKLIVSVSCDTEGAVITYGLDSPDADEEYYTEPIVLTEGSHTLNVMATAGGAQSQVVSATYNVSKPCQFSDFANGDMEAWEEGVPAGWTTSSTASSENYEQTTDAHSGSYAVKVKGNNSSNQRMAFKEMFVKAGTYTLKAYAKDATGGATAAQATLGCVPFTLQDAGWYKVGSYQYISEKVVGEDGKTSTNIIYADLSTSDWTEITGTVTIAEDCIASFLLMSKCKNVGSDVIFDDFSIELGEPTAITSVEATKKASAIYDLSGRRVEKASKGIFIIGGKKVVK